jgi:hypothetical protein
MNARNKANEMMTKLSREALKFDGRLSRGDVLDAANALEDAVDEIDRLAAPNPSRRITIQNLINQYPTRQAAADAAGVNRVTIHNYVAGRTDPKWFTFLALCRGAGMDPLEVTR